MKRSGNSKIVWFKKSSAGIPDLVETDIEGNLESVLEHAKSLACDESFLMGQILADDGLVIATIAPQGFTRIN